MLARYPELNVLVTMAGIMRVEDWHRPERSSSRPRTIVTTNVLGPIRLIAAFIEHLQTPAGRHIVTVSSGLAFAPLKVTPSYNASKAAIHMLSEALRLQLADTLGQVARARAAGGADRPAARPGRTTSTPCRSTSSSTEVMTLLETRPDATEIQVERVKFLRYGEARGDYDQVVATLNQTDPHGS